VYPNATGDNTDYYTYTSTTDSSQLGPSLLLTLEDDNYGTSAGPNRAPNGAFTLVLAE
jgi:hypothetical protein